MKGLVQLDIIKVGRLILCLDFCNKCRENKSFRDSLLWEFLGLQDIFLTLIFVLLQWIYNLMKERESVNDINSNKQEGKQVW